MNVRSAKILLLTLSSITFSLFSCSPVQNYLSPDKPKFAGEYSNNPRLSDDQIRVVSFNIKFGEKIRQSIKELSQYPQLKDADIILLQEMDERGCESIARALQYDYVYYPSVIHRHHHKNLGNAILSKWPLKDERKIILPYSDAVRNIKRSAVSARIGLKGLEVLVYSVHTSTVWLDRERRISQADSLLRSVPEDADYVIMGGDFNTPGYWNVSMFDHLFAKDGFVRASRHAGSTYKIGPVKMTLDHIFVKGLEPVSSGTVKSSTASDHLPLWAILKPVRSSSFNKFENEPARAPR